MPTRTDRPASAPKERSRRGWQGVVLRLLSWSLGAAVLLALMGVAFAAGGWFALRASVGSAPVKVPGIVDMTEDEARRATEALGLVFQVVEERHDRRAPSGRVISQIPEAGSVTREGRTIRVVKSLGEAVIHVPDVVGSPDREARLELQQLGFRIGAVTYVPASAPESRVIAQRPAAGEPRTTGDPVNLLVSRGHPAKRLVMPDVVGRRASEAKRALEKAGLRVTLPRRVKREGIPKGYVLDQRPAAGTPVGQRRGVTLIVSE